MLACMWTRSLNTQPLIIMSRFCWPLTCLNGPVVQGTLNLAQSLTLNQVQSARLNQGTLNPAQSLTLNQVQSVRLNQLCHVGRLPIGSSPAPPAGGGSRGVGGSRGAGCPFFRGFLRIPTKSAWISLNISCEIRIWNQWTYFWINFLFLPFKTEVKTLTEPYTDEIINIWPYILL
jgi:hypothetical protein